MFTHLTQENRTKKVSIEIAVSVLMLMPTIDIFGDMVWINRRDLGV